VMGHEISATVAEDSTRRFEPGARVVPYPYRGCGRCLWCTEGHPMFCLEPAGHWGGYAELAVYGSQNLLAIPDELDERTAALTEPLGVATRAVRMAGVGRDELAFVGGLG